MLEMFFDNEKVFSVFSEMIKTGDEEIEVPKILYNMGIPPKDGAEILQSFAFLGILEEIEKTEETGIFKFNPKSPIVLGLCIFDDIVGQYTFDKIKNDLFDGGKENNDEFALLKELLRQEESDDDSDLFRQFMENGLNK